MIKVASINEFVDGIKPGDIGLICANNFFATLQNWYRKKEKEGPLQASHGFFVPNPPAITEADGLFVSHATFLKDIGDKTKAWFFRWPMLTLDQLDDMVDYTDGMVDAGGHYSVGGICQFGLQFFGVRKKVSNEGGVFCTELTSLTILKAKLPYITDTAPYAITPSHQLNWFMTAGAALGWVLAGHYDGAGGYFLQEEPNGKPNTSTNPDIGDAGLAKAA